MKIKTILVLLFTLMTNLISAQYGNNGYGNNGYGSGRMQNSGQNIEQSPSKPKEISVEEKVAKIMENLTPELKLDGLQEVAVSNVLIESLSKQGILMKNNNLSQDAKIEEYKSLSEKTNKMINAYLNPVQQEKYKVYIEDSQNSRKSKKKKKTDK